MCMNKPKVNEKWIGKRLVGSNIVKYLNDNNFLNANIIEDKTLQIRGFLQQKYGGEGDCTLTSILTIVKYYKPELNENEIYDYIEKIAKKYLYREQWGTFAIFNKIIIKEVFEYFKINKKVTIKYFKEIGFNKDTIINELKQKHPIILSLTNDGRNYYRNHTITIIGYRIYKNDNNKQKILFKIYDNWYYDFAFLDYEILKSDCSICY